MCDFCRDFTTWEPINAPPELPKPSRKSKTRKANIPPAEQLRMFQDD
jgi:hypothetical protein